MVKLRDRLLKRNEQKKDAAGKFEIMMSRGM